MGKEIWPDRAAGIMNAAKHRITHTTSLAQCQPAAKPPDRRPDLGPDTHKRLRVSPVAINMTALIHNTQGKFLNGGVGGESKRGDSHQNSVQENAAGNTKSIRCNIRPKLSSS
jgi:hypothetical protein